MAAEPLARSVPSRASIEAEGLVPAILLVTLVPVAVVVAVAADEVAAGLDAAPVAATP